MSSSDTIISVEGLSKSYLIGHERQTRGYQTFRESLLRGLKGFAALLSIHCAADRFSTARRSKSSGPSRTLASRSSAARCSASSGAMAPANRRSSRFSRGSQSQPRAAYGSRGEWRGLLEVGTGFHAELTGRENIFLNGAILGMSKTEIKRKFDEHRCLRGKSRNFSTRRSSAIPPACMCAWPSPSPPIWKPEILIVDEVLAVGDAEFQKKCLGKMNEVANGGRTVIFVSHNYGRA